MVRVMVRMKTMKTPDLEREEREEKKNGQSVIVELSGYICSGHEVA